MSAMLTAHQLHLALPGSHLVGDGAATFSRVHTDSRSLQAGDLFVALQGERFDANDFLAEAVDKGASMLLCHPQTQTLAAPRVEVADTKLALGALAQHWRARHTIPLIAVTGSNGKTTVTQMIASILQAAWPGGESLATIGNLNNDIGVPQTLLRLREQHRIAVVEMGMNHPGEIAYLAAMTQPTVALVNNAQREHLEFMQTVEAVARENGTVIQALPAHGTAVFPANDDYTPLWRALAGARRCVTFAMAGVAGPDQLVCQSAQWNADHWDVRAEGLGATLRLQLHIAGRHNVQNALAAAACALAAGVSAQAVEAGLAAFAPVKGRSRALSVPFQNKTITLVDDTYNANPDSMRAAIDVLAELPGPRLLVLGDMGEVGEQGPEFHTEAGAYAQVRGIEHLMATGILAEHAVAAFAGGQHFASKEALNAAAVAALAQVRSVLVKGSRFMRMEQVIAALTEHGQTQPGEQQKCS